jgi:hypothetical protein
MFGYVYPEMRLANAHFAQRSFSPIQDAVGLLTFDDRHHASAFAARVEREGAASWLRLTDTLAEASIS